MTCANWWETISAAADNELEATERHLLDVHLETCVACADLLRSLEHDRRRSLFASAGAPVELADAIAARRTEQRTASARSGAILLRRLTVSAVVVAAAIIGVVIVLSSASDQVVTRSETATAPAEVRIDALATSFDHPHVEVRAGATVEWRNDGATKHHLVRHLGTATVAEDLAPGEAESTTFAAAGTYEFSCTIHPEMTGSVTVDA